ncbi:hypothetical protein AL524_12035 [Citrobacter amalonaticus]|nr:hypothetical protein AL524_12035 [Citrobacter amalonaticus]
MKNTAFSNHFMRTAIPAKCYENVVFKKTDFQPSLSLLLRLKGDILIESIFVGAGKNPYVK